MSRKGFTLSEVLIAIFLLGVISAILVPVISNAAPDRNKIMFRKAYFSLEKAVNLMINNKYIYPAVTGTDSTGATVKRGFNYTTAVGNGTTNKFCYYLTQSMNTVGTVTCPAASAAGWSNLASFRTTDGIQWWIYFFASDSAPGSQFTLAPEQPYPVLVYMDVNGEKGPNCTVATGLHPGIGIFDVCPVTTSCESNPDRFIVNVRYDGKLHVGGYHDSAHTDLCAESILSDPTNNQ